MAIKRKLAVGLLATVAAAVAIGGSLTLAWYFANFEAKTVGLSIKAKAADQLQISKDGTSWGETLDLGIEDAVRPSACLNSDGTSYSLVSSEPNGWIGSKGLTYIVPKKSNRVQSDGTLTTGITLNGLNTPEGFETVDSSSTVKGYLTGDYYVRYDSRLTDTMPMTITVSVEAERKTIIDSAMVGIMEEGSTNPLVVWKLGNHVKNGVYQDLSIDTTLPYGDANKKHYSIYAWYDGTDSNCVTANMIEDAVEFSVRYDAHHPGYSSSSAA